MYKRPAPSSQQEIEEPHFGAKVSAYSRFTNKSRCKGPERLGWAGPASGEEGSSGVAWSRLGSCSTRAETAEGDATVCVSKGPKSTPRKGHPCCQQMWGFWARMQVPRAYSLFLSSVQAQLSDGAPEKPTESVKLYYNHKRLQKFIFFFF